MTGCFIPRDSEKNQFAAFGLSMSAIFFGEYGAAGTSKSATNVFLIAVGLIPRSLLRKVFTGAG
jgi:hypothetical protein